MSIGDMEITTENAAAAALGAMIGEPKRTGDGDTPFAVVPKGCKILSLESLAADPARIRGSATFIKEKDFNRYTMDFGTGPRGSDRPYETRLFADLASLTVVAVLDYHGTVPNWCEHRAVFAPPQHPDLIQWRKHNEEVMAQPIFAQFIEDMIPTIFKPSGADMLELAQDLEARKSTTFKSAERLTSGLRTLHFEETATGKVATSKVEMPDELILKLPVFIKGDPVELVAKMRHRVDNGSLVFWYRLHRIEDVVEKAFERITDAVAVETKYDVAYGVPPAATESVPRFTG